MKQFLLIFLVSVNFLFSEIYLDNINSSEYPEITADIYVSSSNNARVDLNSSDIRIFENSDVEILNLDCSNTLKNESKKLLLVIESTASISSRELRLIRRIVEELMTKYESGVRIGITTFNNYSFLLSEFTNDPNRINQSLDLILPNGIGTLNTAFLSETINSIDIAKEENAKILFITDGDIAGNTNAIINRAADAGVEIHSMILGFDSNEPLDNISRVTGGIVYPNVNDDNYKARCGAVMSDLIYEQPCRITWRSDYCNTPAIGNIVHVPSATNFDFEYEFPEEAINLTFLPSEVVKIEDIVAGQRYADDITLYAYNSDFEIIDVENDCEFFEVVNFPTGLLSNKVNHKIEFDYTAPDEEYRICEFTIKTNECNDIKFFVEVGRKDNGIGEPQLDIVFPNGGEIFFPSEEIEVLWSDSNPLDTFDIHISRNDRDWEFLENVKTGNKAEVRLPQIESNNYKIRVSQFSGNDILNGVYYLDLGGNLAREFKWNRNSERIAIYTEASEIEIWDPFEEEIIGIAGENIIDGFAMEWGNVTNQIAIINNFGSKDIVIFDGGLENDIPIKLNGNNEDFTCLSWNGDDSEIVAGTSTGDIVFYSPDDDNPKEKIEDFSNAGITRIEYHPTENWIYTLNQLGDVRVRDLDSGEDYLIRDLGSDPANFRLSDTGDTLLIYSQQRGTFLAEISKQVGGTFDSEILLRDENIEFNVLNRSGNKRALILSNDNTIQLIDENTKDTIYQFSGHQEEISAIEYEADWAASYTGGDQIQVWNINEEHSPFILQRDVSDDNFRIVPVRILTYDIDLGDICKDFMKDTIIENAYLNSSEKEVIVDDIYISNDPDFNFSRPLETQQKIAVDQFGDIRILASPKTAGFIEAEYTILAQNQLFTGKITANVIEPKFEPSREILDLGDINLGEDQTIIFDIVTNVSNEAGIIDSAKIFFPESTVTLPFGVISSGETVEYEGVFNFDKLGPVTGLTRVFTQDNCTPIQIPVKANVIAPKAGLAASGELKLLDCESTKKDTVGIRNVGEGILRILSGSSNNPNVNINILDNEAASRSIARVELEYTLENPGIDSVDIFVQTNIQEDLRESSSFRVYFRRIDSRYLTNKTNFLFVEPNVKQELNIQNTGDRKLEIKLPETEDFLLELNGQNTLLLPGDQVKVGITSLPIDAPIPDRLASTTINLLGFCEDREIIISSDFTGQLPVISSFEELIFGEIICSEESRDTTFTIENIGNAELTLDNIRIEGENSDNFEIDNSSDRIILPGQSEEFTITFTPDGSINNDVTFTAETNSNQNNGVYELPINLRFLDAEFNFDESNEILEDLEFNTEYFFEIEVENLGNIASSISPNLVLSNGQFVIDSISNNPAEPGEVSIIHLRFQGGDINEVYQADLSFLDNCGREYSKRFEINVIGTRNFEISVGEFSGKPGEFINIPLVVSNPNSSELPIDGSYSATLSFNSTILHSSSTFSGVEGNKRWVELKGDLNDELSGESILSTDLLVTLGNVEQSELEIEAEFENANAYKFIGNDGIFSYDSEYLLDNPGLVDGTLRINFQGPNPNPVQQEFYISFNMIEEGNCTIELIDSHGKRIRTIVNEELRTGFKEYNFNSLELSSGFYFLHFRTPTYSKLVPFTVVN